MVDAQGLRGPDVAAHLLPTESPPLSEAAIEAAREALGFDDTPLVLVVGSHEPRKNHVTVLVAAEQLWRQGKRFRLVFVGARGWRGDRFDDVVRQLDELGRPVHVVKAADEATLWGAYRLARFTVFPSLSEGFGLPVAESLASGTPAITSAFGSMAEVAASGGALTIDPRDPDSLATAMASLLDDDELLAELRRQARARPSRSWDRYSDETWAHLVD